jgi:hypothetical protein
LGEQREERERERDKAEKEWSTVKVDFFLFSFSPFDFDPDLFRKTARRAMCALRSPSLFVVGPKKRSSTREKAFFCTPATCE